MATIKRLVKHFGPVVLYILILMGILAWLSATPAGACNFITIGGFRFCLPG